MVKIKVKDKRRFAELIYKNGLTIRSLARASGLSDTTIQLMLDGTREGCSSTTAQKVLKVLEAYGIRFDDLFFIDNAYKSKKRLNISQCVN